MIPKLRLRRWAAAIGTAAALISGGLESTATALPQTKRPKCTLTVPASPRSEAPPSCVAVDLTLDKLPAVGETAALRVRLRSQVAVPHAQLTVRVPDTLQLITEGSPLSAPRQVGPWQQAKGVMALNTHKQSLTLHVRATAAGPVQIEAGLSDADAPSPEREAHDSVLLTVGKKSSSAGHGSSRSGVDITSLPGRSGARRSKSTSVSEKFAKVPKPTRTAASSPSAASITPICVNGGFHFTNQAGTWLGGRNLTVKVWGKTTSTAAQQVYASGLTNNTGAFNLCFTPPVSSMYSLYVEFRSESSVWQVVGNNGWVYSTTTSARSNVSTNQNFGWTAPAAAQMRAWHAFDTLNLTWWWRSSNTSCWTSLESAPNCSKMTVQWWPGNADGGYYNPGANAAASYIRLRDNDPDSEHLVIHESGHALMHMLYNWWWPNVNCAGHQIHAASSTGCAWTEGFANALAGSVKGDNKFVWPNGSEINLMNSTWFNSSQPVSSTNWHNGDAVEGRVAGSLIDLWNQADNGQSGTINLMRTQGQSNFGEYFKDDRPAVSLSTSNTARNLLYGHTIDYRASLLNSSFENGTAGWNWTASPSGSVIGNWSTYPARSGSMYAWLGGMGEAATQSLSEQVTIPSNVNAATMAFYNRIGTFETEQSAYDTLKVQVIDGATTSTLGTLSNLNAVGSYTYRSYNLSAWRGKTVTIKLVSTEDATLRTDFVVDDITVTTS
ncbi:mycolysin [Streptomyces sp. KR80]|uniref:mycolysin n=1 Tax=Streptomyces sp. KR80 TaxID=3457426 RepID=UPI003FCFE4FE